MSCLIQTIDWIDGFKVIVEKQATFIDKALSDAEPPRGVQLRKIASGLLPSLTRSLAESRYRSQIRYHQNKTLSRRCGGGYIQA